jgi:hypothetical protein
MAFKTSNTLEQLTKPKQASNTQELDKSISNKLTYNTYQTAYIGQTSRNFRQRYQEHISYIRHNNPQSAHAQHILNKRHKYGPINNTMSLLKHINKISLLLPYKQLYIQTHQQHEQLFSEQSTDKYNSTHQLTYDTFHTSLPTRPTDPIPTSNRIKPVPS